MTSYKRMYIAIIEALLELEHHNYIRAEEILREARDKTEAAFLETCEINRIVEEKNISDSVIDED